MACKVRGGCCLLHQHESTVAISCYTSLNSCEAHSMYSINEAEPKHEGYSTSFGRCDMCVRCSTGGLIYILKSNVIYEGPEFLAKM